MRATMEHPRGAGSAKPVKLYCGTSGFSFPEWIGAFYPADLPRDGMLAFYAQQLPSVEINATFYRMPKRHVLAGWAAQVPDGFRFAIKASRRITHGKKLVHCEDEVGYLFRGLDELGDKLGAVLFQLPPHAKADPLAIDAFLALLPEGTRAAFEFRHASWDTEDVADVLNRHGAARVVADSTGIAPAAAPGTAEHAYLRLRADNYDDTTLHAFKALCTNVRRKRSANHG